MADEPPVYPGIVPDKEVDRFLGAGLLNSLAWGNVGIGAIVVLMGIGLAVLFSTGPFGGGEWPDPPAPWLAPAVAVGTAGVAFLLIVGGWRLRQRRLSGQTYAFIGNGILLLAGLAYTAWNGEWRNLMSVLPGPLVMLLFLRSKHTVSLLVNP